MQSFHTIDVEVHLSFSYDKKKDGMTRMVSVRGRGEMRQRKERVTEDSHRRGWIFPWGSWEKTKASACNDWDWG